jgi:hypothetical protein
MTGESFKHSETAVDEFNRRGNRSDGARVTTSLNAGLSVLRDLMYERMHRDVESVVGIDSMLMPVSELKTQQEAKTAIDVFQIAESACAARQAGYLGEDSDWYADWLAETRLGTRYQQQDSGKQVAAYLALDANGRRLAMSDIMSRVLPESRQAPLVLFRLVPLAVHIVTALAFGDRQRADDLRGQQQALLPAISDCRECHGAVLDNGQICETCGNPMWTFKWLTIAD